MTAKLVCNLETAMFRAMQEKQYYSNPIEPAVKPIIRKNENSAKSLGKELTISFI